MAFSETVDEAVDYISFLRNNPLELTKVKLALGTHLKML